VTTNKIDGIDVVPMIYENEVRIGFNCAKPLFISNQISILSPVVKSERPAIMDLWKAFHNEVWTFILLTFLIIVIINKIISMFGKNEERNNRFFYYIWIYFKALIEIGERFKYQNYIYILWVLSIGQSSGSLRDHPDNRSPIE